MTSSQEKVSKKRVYSRKSRATRFKKVHVIHHPQLKEPILLTPEILPNEPIVIVPSMPAFEQQEIHEIVAEKIKKKSWWSWLTD